jgi:hypothetical protein
MPQIACICAAWKAEGGHSKAVTWRFYSFHGNSHIDSLAATLYFAL